MTQIKTTTKQETIISTPSVQGQFQNGTNSQGKLYCPVHWLHLKS